MSGLREKHKVLVIDDEVNVSDTLALIFTKEGYEARVAYSAEEAIESSHSGSRTWRSWM
jgi:DNA-binding response OmpR family regulator